MLDLENEIAARRHKLRSEYLNEMQEITKEAEGE
jgi:hypothetical protein